MVGLTVQGPGRGFAAQISASRPVSQAVKMKAILNGVHAETKVEQYITFTMLSESGKTRVIAVGYTRLSNGIRSELQEITTGNAEAISTIQSRLGQVKQKAES